MNRIYTGEIVCSLIHNKCLFETRDSESISHEDSIIPASNFFFFCSILKDSSAVILKVHHSKNSSHVESCGMLCR